MTWMGGIAVKIQEKEKDQFIGYMKSAPFNILDLKYHTDFQI